MTLSSLGEVKPLLTPFLFCDATEGRQGLVHAEEVALPLSHLSQLCHVCTSPCLLPLTRDERKFFARLSISFENYMQEFLA